jgi:hypothetical protein
LEKRAKKKPKFDDMDMDMDLDIAAEMELFGHEEDAPSPPPAKKQKVKKVSPIDACIAHAQQREHAFLYKQGNLNSNNYLSISDALEFWSVGLRLS